MNNIRRQESEADELARLGAIVREHKFPSFVIGYEFRLGEYEGDPVVWVVFKTNQDLPRAKPDADRWVGEANALVDEVRHEIVESGEQRFPFFRFEVATERRNASE